MTFNSFSADVFMFQEQIQDPTLSCQMPLASKRKWPFLFISLSFMTLFIYLATPSGPCGIFCSMWDLWSSLWPVESLVAASGNLPPWLGLNLGPLHWEHGVSVTGSPGKSQPWHFWGEPISSFIKCPSAWVCLFSTVEMNYATFFFLVRWCCATFVQHLSQCNISDMSLCPCGWYWPGSLG